MSDTALDDPALTSRGESTRTFPDDFIPPQSLAEMPTSGWLGVELDMATPHPEVLDDAELVDAIVGFDRLAAWASARQAALLAEFARRRPADSADAAQAEGACTASPYAADEIGLALRLSRGTAAVRVMQAQRLDAELVGTRQAWQDGQLDATRVRAVLEATVNLDPAVATAVQDRVLVRAPQQTAGQLRAALGRAVITADPTGAGQRHEKAARIAGWPSTPSPTGWRRCGRCSLPRTHSRRTSG